MTNKEETQVYELGYLILPSIPEDNLPEVVGKIKAAIAASNGVEIDGEEPFKHALSYSMSKTVGASRYVVSDAYIGWVKFELEPEKALEVKTAIDQTEEVLRSLLIKAPRESAFTFAKAQAALVEKEREAEAPVVAEEVAEPVVE